MKRGVILLIIGCVALPAAQTRSAAKEEASGWTATGTLEPFDGPVRQHALSPDGRWAATVGNDSRLVLWDVRQGQRVLTVTDASDPHNGLLAFSADSSLLASLVPTFGEDDPAAPGLRVFATATGTELTSWKRVHLAETKEHMPARLFHHASGAVVFDPGAWAREIVVAPRPRLSSPGTPPRREWRLSPDGTRIHLLKASGIVGGPVPDGKRRDALRFKTYAVHDGRHLGDLSLEARDVPRQTPHVRDACAFSDAEVACAKRGVVHVHALADQKELYTFGQGVTALTRRGKHWLTGDADGAIEIREGRKRVARIELAEGPIRSIKHAADTIVVRTQKGHAVVRGTAVVHRAEGSVEGGVHGDVAWLRWHDGTTRILRPAHEPWELAADKPEYDETDRRNRPAVAGGHIIAVPVQRRLACFDLRSQARIASLGGHRGRITDLRWDGNRVLCRGGTDGYYVAPLGAALIDATTSKEVTRAPTGTVHLQGDQLLALEPRIYKQHGPLVVSPTGKQSARWEGTEIAVFEGVHGRPLFRLPAEHNRHGVSLAFHPDGTRLAAAWVGRRPGTLDVRVRVWNLALRKAEYEHVLPRESYPVKEVRWSPRGRWLGVQLRQLRVFDETGALRHARHVGPSNSGSAWAFTPDGSHVVGASHAGPVEIFDLDQGRATHTFDMPRETYSHWVRLTMAPDGRSFALHYSERRLAFLIDMARGAEGMQRFETWRARGWGGHVLDFFPDGDLAVLTKAGLMIWDAEMRAQRARLSDVRGSGVSIAPSGDRLAVIDGSRVTLFSRNP